MFILSSANPFDLDQSKVLLFGKELNISSGGYKFENFRILRWNWKV